MHLRIRANAATFIFKKNRKIRCISVTLISQRMRPCWNQTLLLKGRKVSSPHLYNLFYRKILLRSTNYQNELINRCSWKTHTYNKIKYNLACAPVSKSYLFPWWQQRCPLKQGKHAMTEWNPPGHTHTYTHTHTHTHTVPLWFTAQKKGRCVMMKAPVTSGWKSGEEDAKTSPGGDGGRVTDYRRGMKMTGKRQMPSRGGKLQKKKTNVSTRKGAGASKQHLKKLKKREHHYCDSACVLLEGINCELKGK